MACYASRAAPAAGKKSLCNIYSQDNKVLNIKQFVTKTEKKLSKMRTAKGGFLLENTTWGGIFCIFYPYVNRKARKKGNPHNMGYKLGLTQQHILHKIMHRKHPNITKTTKSTKA